MYIASFCYEQSSVFLEKIESWGLWFIAGEVKAEATVRVALILCSAFTKERQKTSSIASSRLLPLFGCIVPETKIEAS